MGRPNGTALSREFHASTNPLETGDEHTVARRQMAVESPARISNIDAVRLSSAATGDTTSEGAQSAQETQTGTSGFGSLFHSNDASGD